jgi:peptide/nickel transport system ATP-binding protein
MVFKKKCLKRLNIYFTLMNKPLLSVQNLEISFKRRGLYRCYQEHQLWFTTEWNPQYSRIWFWEVSLFFSDYRFVAATISRISAGENSFDSKNVGHLSEKELQQTQRQWNRHDFPGTYEFNPSKMWFSGTEILLQHTACQEQLKPRHFRYSIKLNYRIRKYYSINISWDFRRAKTTYDDDAMAIACKPQLLLRTNLQPP